MRSLRKPVVAALAISLALHFAIAVALTYKKRSDMEFEGAGEVQHPVLGESPFNTVAAGTIDSSAISEPVERDDATQPVSRPKPVVEAVQPATQPAVAPVAAAAVATPEPQLSASLPDMTPNALAMMQAPRVEPLETLPPIESQPEKTPDKTTEALPQSAKVPPGSSEAAKPAPPAAPVEQAEPDEAQPVTPTPAKAVQPSDPRKVEAIEVEETDVAVTETETAETEPVPTPPKKPSPVRQKPDATKQVKKNAERKSVKAENPRKNQQKAEKASRAGSGGKSGRTAQKGGSQRKGKGKTAGNSDVTNYPAKVYRKLLRTVRAPRGGKKARTDAVVRFTVRKNGSVSGTRLARSSGSKNFDQAVLKAVQRASFPPIPAAAGRSSWTFTLPVAMK
ncbi:energy transducer TonB [Roseibium aggregatum]|uniref:TonB family protein n=1 Tax=Roseibium aggregatum TaxID=187304 RepID=A0A939EFA7_9HYPH|nr:TonB family protein [Roseibium aggregatum]MBN9671928.1 TonB family protein [Roseibium aggregatum]